MPYPPVSVPVALLVGSGCVSSRDEVAQVFSDYRFGPLVGEPTAAGYRVLREQIELSFGPHRKLGFLSLALSYEVSGKTGLPVEAVPLTLTRRVPRTEKNRTDYDHILVDEAIGALRKGRWPVFRRRR